MNILEGKTIEIASWLRSQREDQNHPIKLLCELIDNSLEAYFKNKTKDNAKKLEILIYFPYHAANHNDNKDFLDKSYFQYFDNIIGLQGEEKELFGQDGYLNPKVTIDYIQKKEEESMSRYGQGLKDFSRYLGDRILIKSINNNIPTYWQANIKDVDSEERNKTFWKPISKKEIENQWNSVDLRDKKWKFHLAIDICEARKENKFIFLSKSDNVKVNEIKKILFLKYYRFINDEDFNIRIKCQQGEEIVVNKKQCQEFFKEIFYSTDDNSNDERIFREVTSYLEKTENVKINENFSTDEFTVLSNDFEPTIYSLFSSAIKNLVIKFKTEHIINDQIISFNHKIKLVFDPNKGKIGGISLFQDKRAIVMFPNQIDDRNIWFKGWFEGPQIKPLKMEKFEYRKSIGSGKTTINNLYWEIDIPNEKGLFNPSTNKMSFDEHTLSIISHAFKKVYEKLKINYILATWFRKKYLENKETTVSVENKEPTNLKIKQYSDITAGQQKKVIKTISSIDNDINKIQFEKKDNYSYMISNDNKVIFCLLENNPDSNKFILNFFRSCTDLWSEYDNEKTKKIIDKYNSFVENPDSITIIIVNTNSKLFQVNDKDLPLQSKATITLLISTLVAKAIQVGDTNFIEIINEKLS